MEDTLTSIPDIQNQEIAQRIKELYTSGKRISAIQAFRIASGKGLKESTILLSEWWAENKLKLIDESSYPEICCMHCIGACGRLKTIKKESNSKLWDLDADKAKGSDCPLFISTKQIENGFGFDGFKIIIRSPDSRYITYSVFGRIVKINSHHEPESADFCTFESYQASCNFISKEVGKKLYNNNFSIVERNSFKESFYIKGKKPWKGESFSSYKKRIEKYFREKRVKASQKFKNISLEEAVNFMNKFFREEGLGEILDDTYGGDVSQMCFEFYPDTDIRSLAETMYKNKEL